MKNKYKIIPIAGITLIFLSCIMTAEAVENPITLGTIDYLEIEYFMIDSDNEVDLVYIESELPSQYLAIEKTQYYPSTNETKYKATSNVIINPDPNMIPEVKSYQFQDLNSGQIYIINVDYTSLEIPLSNTEQELINLLENYTNLQDNYAELFIEYGNLTNQWNIINNTLSEYTNLTGKKLTNVTQDLLLEYNTVKEDMNQAFDDLAELYSHYNVTKTELDAMKTEYDELLIQHSDLMALYHDLNESYNMSCNRVLELGSNLSEYINFKDHLDSPMQSGFYFKNNYYYPTSYYRNQINKLEGDLGMYPAYLFLAVFLTLLICFIVARRYVNNLKEPFTEDVNYSEKAQKYDNFILGKLKDTFSLKRTPKTVTADPIVKPETIGKQKPDDNDGKEILDEKIQEIQEDTDEKFEQIKQDMAQLHESIDKILHSNGFNVGGEQN